MAKKKNNLFAKVEHESDAKYRKTTIGGNKKRFKLKKVTIKVNKTEVAKRYGAESVSVSN